MQPIEIACRHVQPDGWNCGAEPGDPCLDANRQPLQLFHAERIEDAAEMSDQSGIEPTEEQFEQAEEDTGLF